MCGFFISNSKIVNRRHNEIVNNRLKFRGPDYNSGLLFHNGWHIYHSRLSIIGLNKASNQPIVNKDGSISLMSKYSHVPALITAISNLISFKAAKVSFSFVASN